MQSKKRMEKYKEAGLFNVGTEDDDFANVKYFDISDGFDPELMQVLNMKI